MILDNEDIVKEKMYVYGQFCLYGKSTIKPGDNILISKVKSKENESAPFYPSNEVVNHKVFEINPYLHSWNYSCTLSTHNTYLYSFNVYLFVEDINNPSYYTCFRNIISPPFHICASRRAVTRRQEIMEQQQIQQMQQQFINIVNSHQSCTYTPNYAIPNTSSYYQNPLSFSSLSVQPNDVQSTISQIPSIQSISPFQEYNESIQQIIYNISTSPDFCKLITPLLTALQLRKEISKDDRNNIMNYTLLQLPNIQPSDRFEINTTGMTKEQFILEMDRPYYQLDNEGNSVFFPSPLYLISTKIYESISK